MRRSLAALIRDLTRPHRGDLLRQQRGPRRNRSRSPRAMPAAAWRWSAARCATSMPRRASAATCTTLPPFLAEDEADDVPDDNLLILVTGSQGEPRSALARIAADTHPHIALGEGDTVIFSSRVIPGNERAIGRCRTIWCAAACALMTDDDHMVHVSGHPGARRAAAAVSPGAAAIRACRCMASGGICRPTPRWREETGRDADPDGGRRHPAAWRRAGRRWSTARRSAGWRWTATGWCRCSGGVMAARRRMLFNGVVLAQPGGRRERPAARHSRGSARPACSSRTIRRRARVDARVRRRARRPARCRCGGTMRRWRTRRGRRCAARSGKRLQKRPMVDVHLLRV